MEDVTGSPRPWKIEEKASCLSIKDRDGFTVANLSLGYGRKRHLARCWKDAQVIVDAVNELDD
jgi:hypothetical protein